MSVDLKSSKQRGTAAVEFALILPILIFLFLGITEFGIAYYNKQVLTNASREGARAGIVAGTEVVDIKEIIKNYVLGSYEHNNEDENDTDSNNENDTEKNRLITFGTNDFNTNYSNYITVTYPDAEYLKVSIYFEYDYFLLSMFKFFGANFGPELKIGASTTMRME